MDKTHTINDQRNYILIFEKAVLTMGSTIVTKIEELLITVYEYERLSMDILSRLFNLNSDDQVTLDKMAESVEVADKLEMLCALYFPKIEFDFNEGQKVILKAHKDNLKVGESYIHPKSSYSTYEKSTKQIKDLLAPLKDNTKKLMRVHT